MIQAAAVTDEKLDAIVQAIVDRFRPARIVLFGSRARGTARPHSDYDVYVELESVEGDTRETVNAALAGLGGGVQVVISTPERFAELRDDPGMLHYDIAREGVVVYGASGVVAYPPPPSASRVREGPPFDYPSLKWWRRRADSDFHCMEREAGRENLDPCPVAFHAHQSAEKYLKLVLIAMGVHPERTHVLSDVLKDCPPSLSDREDLARACGHLQQFYLSSRYPDDGPKSVGPEPTRADAQQCVLSARTVRQAILADTMLGRLLSDPPPDAG